jgi:hypothetical protein
MYYREFLAQAEAHLHVEYLDAVLCYEVSGALGGKEGRAKS